MLELNKDVKSLVIEALRYHNHIYTQPLQIGQQYKPRGEEKLLLIPSGEKRLVYDVKDSDTKFHFLKLTKDELFEQETMKIFPMSFALRSLAIVGLEDFSFVLGTDNESFNPVVLRDNVTSDHWVNLKTPPHPATIGTAVTKFQDKIFLLGGMCVMKDDTALVSERFTNKNLQYSIGANCWTKMHTMPQAVIYHDAVAHRDLVYVASGFT